MRAVILAAGVGRRLRPHTESSAKSMLLFGGKTLMRRHLDILSRLPVEESFVVVGHCADQG